jgi:pimeloyl-ACP methyl ester carboxylesterase
MSRTGSKPLTTIEIMLVRMSGESGVTSRTIEANGAALYVEECGDGAPIVLIHGGLGSSAMMRWVVSFLSDDFRVITPDSRGHGRSTNPSGRLSYAQLADDVAALIATMGLNRPVVAGFSDGGQVALELGARHPDVPAVLVVAAAYPDFANSGVREVLSAYLGADEQGNPDLAQVDARLGDFADLVKSWHPGGEQQWRALVTQSAPMWIDYAGLSADEVHSIEAPVLVFTGDRDNFIGVDLSVALFRALPNAELAVVPGTDHIGTVGQARAELFANMIRDFAARHTSDS